MKADSMRWQAERARGGAGGMFMLWPFCYSFALTAKQARYSQSIIHRERAAYGPTPTALSQRRPSQQSTSYGSMRSQSAIGSLPSRTYTGPDPGFNERETRSDASFGPVSRTSSHVDNYTGTAYAPTQPMTIVGRRPRRDSIDSMYGFAMSPMIDEMRHRGYELRRCRHG